MKRLMASLLSLSILILAPSLPARADSTTEVNTLDSVNNEARTENNAAGAALLNSTRGISRVAALAQLVATAQAGIVKLASVPVTSKEAREYQEIQIQVLVALVGHDVCGLIPRDYPTIGGVILMLECLGPVNAIVITGANRTQELSGPLRGLSGPPLTPLTEQEIAEGAKIAAGYANTSNLLQTLAAGTSVTESLAVPFTTFNRLKSTDTLFRNLSNLPDDYRQLVSIAGDAQLANTRIATDLLSPYFGTINGSGLKVADTHQLAQPTPGSTDGLYLQVAKAVDKQFIGAGRALLNAEQLSVRATEFRNSIQQLADGVLGPGYDALQASGDITAKGNAVAKTVQTAQLTAYSEALFASALMHHLGTSRGLEAYQQVAPTATAPRPAATALTSMQAAAALAATGPPTPARQALEVPLLKAGAPLTVTVDEDLFFIQIGTQHQLRVVEAASGTPVTDAVFMPISAAPGFTVSLDGTIGATGTDSPFANVPSVAWVMVMREADWGVAQVAITDPDPDGDLLGSTWEIQQGLDPNLPDDPLAIVAQVATITPIDSTPPVTSATIDGVAGPNGTYTSTVTISLTSTDQESGVSEIRYSVDGGIETIVPGPAATISLTTDGHHTVSYFAVDLAGNSEPASTIVLDINQSQPQTPRDGIVSGSGKTAPDIGDALTVLKHYLGIEPLDATQQAHADVAPLGPDGRPAGNGSVDLADVIIILRRSLGIGDW